MPDVDTTTRRFLDALDAWLRGQRVQDLVGRDELAEVLRELREDEAFWTRARPEFEAAWARVEARLRAEDRAIRDLIADEAYQRVLDLVEAIEPDPEAVRAFLRSPAVEQSLGQVLYTGIYEFMRKADLLGKVVDRLPVIGPIRKKVMGVLKDELEPLLEGQIKGFLGGFSGHAVERLIQHVLAPEHRDGFRAARRRLAEHVMQRPVRTLLPDPAATARLRDGAWQALRQAAFRDEAEWLRWAFEDHGEVTLERWAWRPGERTRDVMARALERFLGAGEGWTLRPGPGA